MKRPLICLSARDSKLNTTRIYYDNESYFDYVKAGGGIPVLAGTVTEEEAEQIAGLFDGLVVTGGGDCDPALYGEENTHSEIVEHDIDMSDILLYKAFVKAGKPVLGICRGIQLINIAEGGSLIQDIPSEPEGYMEHNQRNLPDHPVGTTAHSCTFVQGSVLHEIFSDSHEVNTYHHQAIRRLAEGFLASAYSTDGLIEGIEKENVTAVQWHPERLIHDEKHLRLMQWFIEQCSAHQTR